MRISDEDLREVDKIVIVACGTAYHAGLVAKYAIEHWTRIPCEVELASEFRYRDPILTRRTLVVAISQSGETMDTLMAVRHAKEQQARVLAICNTNGSTIPRESDAVLYTHAGPEIAVASTKAFLTQIVAVHLVALYLAQVRGTKCGDEVAAHVRELAAMPEKVDRVLDTIEPVRALARSLADAPAGAVPRPPRRLPGGAGGRAQAQGARLHARRGLRRRRAQARPDRADRGGPAGRRGRAVAARPRKVLHDKIVSNIQEVRARGARTIVIAEEGDEAVAPVRRRADPHPADPDAAAAAGRDGAAAGVRLRDGRGARATTSTSRATWPSRVTVE